MRLADLEQQYHEKYPGLRDEPLDLHFRLHLLKDEDRFYIYITDGERVSFMRKVVNCNDVGNALTEFLETEI